MSGLGRASGRERPSAHLTESDSLLSARDTRVCVYCGAVEPGNEGGRCRDGFPHCFQFDWSAYAAQEVKG